MRWRWFALVGAVAGGLTLGLVVLPVSAHPVRIGRYAEIPYGIRPDHPVPTYRGDDRRTGRLRGVAPRRAPVLLWERRLRHRRPRGPVIAADGTLYLGTAGGLTAFGADGAERWSVLLGGVNATPSLAPSGDVVVATRAGLVALVTPEGVVRRSVELGVPVHGPPLVLDDGSIVLVTLDGHVHRLDASLRTLFDVELDERPGSSVTRTSRGLLAVGSGASLRLLDLRGGATRDVELGARASSPIAVGDDGTLWTATSEGLVLAIDPSGRVRSRTDLGSRHHDGAALAIGRDGGVRVPTLQEGLVCVGPGGSERWRAPNPAGYRAAVTLDEEDTALLIDGSGTMRAIAADGAERWQVRLPSYSYEAPVLGRDGVLYVTTDCRSVLQAWAAPP